MSPVLRDPAPASTQLSPEPEHQNDCLIRVDRAFRPHNDASRQRSQSATGANPSSKLSNFGGTFVLKRRINVVTCTLSRACNLSKISHSHFRALLFREGSAAPPFLIYAVTCISILLEANQ